jgi:hypothetical protein
VKRYVVVTVLFISGVQEPDIPLLDVEGKEGMVALELNGPTALNIGVTSGLMTIVNEAVVAHWPGLGVNVYVVVIVLLMAGDHVPVIPFSEVVGSAGMLEPLQYELLELKEGVTSPSHGLGIEKFST